jgi:hypothetical protein
MYSVFLYLQNCPIKRHVSWRHGACAISDVRHAPDPELPISARSKEGL